MILSMVQAAAMTYQQHTKAEKAGKSGGVQPVVTDDMDPKVMRKLIQQQLKKRKRVEARRSGDFIAKEMDDEPTVEPARAQVETASVHHDEAKL